MKNRKWWLFASILILALVFIVVDELEDVAEIEKKLNTQYLPSVSVITLQSQDHKGVILTRAEIKPRWSVSIKAQVSGEIERVFKRALADNQVKKGDILIRIEDSRYLADLHESEQALAEAKLNLLQAQNKSVQDQKDWQRSGIHKTPSNLVLNIPQLEVAKKTLVAAESHVKVMKKRLSYTHIKAPFSGMITERSVSVGQTVLEGDELLSIIQNNTQDISVALSYEQWNRLAKNWKNQAVSIFNFNNVEIAQAHIKHGGAFIDSETRQYRLYLEIDDTSNRQSLVGDFVQVHLPSRVAHNSLMVPESALTRDGFIWYLDDKNHLRKFMAKVFFYRDVHVIIETPSKDILGKHYPSRWRFAITPLASFLVGHRVNAIKNNKE